MPNFFIRCGNYPQSLAFSAYAERQQKIEDLISLLAILDDPDDFSAQCEAYDAIGIDSDSFSNDEVQYIVTNVRKRRSFARNVR